MELILTLANAKGIDMINVGGTNINLIDKSAQTHTAILSEKTINLTQIQTKLGLVQLLQHQIIFWLKQ